MAARKKPSRKLRVPLKKNRGKRTRNHDLTRLAEATSDEVADLETSERLSGKGDLTRYRTVIETDDASEQIAGTEILPGRVLSAIGANHCRVQVSSGAIYHCTVRRLVRTLSRESRNAVVAGDRVWFTPHEDLTGVIERVEPRQTALTRGSRQYAHIIVANIDQAVIVTSVSNPELKLGLVDRFLCSVEKGGIQGIVCINKIDLGSATDLQPVIGEYAQLGYSVILTDALTGEGIAELKESLQGKETVFTGQSGVGKSSLLNAIQPGLVRPTAEISADTGKGRHTTRVTELLQLDGGGWVVDTPGIRQLRLWDVSKEEVEGFFIEFRPFVSRCRFPNCSHLHEVTCGIKQAVSTGMISQRRYLSYVRIFTGDA